MKKIAGVSIIIIVGLVLFFFTNNEMKSVQVNDTSNAEAILPKVEEMLYLFDSTGSFVKINLRLQSVEEKGNLIKHNDIKKYLPEYNRVGPLIFKSRYDQSSNKIYLLTPSQIDLASTVVPDMRNYQILVFQLPEFQVINQLLLTKELGYPPSFLLTSDGKIIIINYKEYKGEGKSEVVTSTLEFYDSGSMEKVDEIIEVANAQDVGSLRTYLNSAFSLDAEFGGSDEIIYDYKETTSVNLSERIFKKYPVIPHDNYLSKVQREQLSRYEVVYPPTGEKYLPRSRVAQHESVMVLLLSSSERGESSFIISDRITKKSIIFDSPFATRLTAHLTPDGRYIIEESSEFRKRDDGYSNVKDDVYRTGDLLIFSTEDGSLVNTISSSPLKGFDVRNICTLKNDKNTTLFQVKDKIYLLDAIGDTGLHEVSGLSDVDVGDLQCM